MDLSFNWLELVEETLNIDYIPEKIWINFWQANLEQEDFNTIVRIYHKFVEAEMILENLSLKDKLLLKYMFNSIHRVKILER
jgi:hypothetical protein